MLQQEIVEDTGWGGDTCGEKEKNMEDIKGGQEQ